MPVTAIIEQLTPTGSTASTMPPTFDILSVTVIHEVNRIPRAEMLFAESFDKKSFEIQESKFFDMGEFIGITIRDEEKGNFQLFKGLIINQRTQVNRLGATLQVELADPAYQLTLDPNYRVFKEKQEGAGVTDKEAIEAIFDAFAKKNAGLKPTATLNKGKLTIEGGKYQNLTQDKVTDWEYMLTRAKKNGSVIFVKEGAVSIMPPKLSEKAKGKEKEIKYELSEIIDLDLVVDANSYLGGYGFEYWEPDKKPLKAAKPAEGKSPKLVTGALKPATIAKALGTDKITFPATAINDKNELTTLANGQLVNNELSLKQGRIKLFGPKSYEIGQTVTLVGFGANLGGDAFISGVKHQLDRNGWTVDLQLGLPKEWSSGAGQRTRSAEESLPAVHGLQLAVVDKIEEKADKEVRIKVKLPVSEEPNNPIWARQLTLYAGDKHGVWFRPEPEDLVVLGFLNDDPREPVIIGSVHRLQKERPIAYSKDNEKKGMVVKQNVGILFDDKEPSVLMSTDLEAQKKLIRIDTKKEVVEIIDEDNKNSIVMNKQGIEVKCDKNLTIESSGDISIKGKNVTIEGSQVELK